jgi:hypothetical protein
MSGFRAEGDRERARIAAQSAIFQERGFCATMPCDAISGSAVIRPDSDMNRGFALVAALAMLIAAAVLVVPARAGEWSTVASTNVTREYPGLAVMRDGRVLAVSGHPLRGESLASAELYDVARDKWTPTGSLNVSRNGVQPGGLITLRGGKVLLAGGGSGNRSVHEAELYDYDSGQWTPTGSMTVPRCVHTATLLDSGNVLVTGGIDWITEEVRETAEIYDAKTGRWAQRGKMHTPRFNHRAVKLPDGRVLVTGGIRAYPDESQVVGSAEIYDPKTGAWRETAPMHSPRCSHAAVLLGDGRVLVVAGASGDKKASRQLSSVEIFDPQAERWSAAAPLREARWGPTADVLRDGRVLVTGGAIAPLGARSSAELFDPKQGTWSDAGKLSQARNGHRSILLDDGRLLVVGGHFIGRYLSSCEVYTPD